MLISFIQKTINRINRYLSINQSFNNYAEANFKFLELGLKNQKDLKTVDINFSRIIDAYLKAKEDQKKASDPYQPGGAWIEEFLNRRIEYINVVKSKDVTGLKKLCENFFRNSGVDGTWTYGYYKDVKSHNTYRKKSYIIDFLYNLEKFKMSLPFTKISNLEIPKHGNPWGYYYEDILINPMATRHYLYAHNINRYLKLIEKPTVCEIGAAFGGVAYFLRRLNPKISYLNFDLPEVQILNHYFLMSNYPSKKFLLYGEAGSEKITTEIIKEFDFILLPNFQLKELEKDSVDMVFNSGSLSEMSEDTVLEYISRINSVSKRYFYTSNSTLPIYNYKEHEEVILSNVVKSDEFKLVSSQQQPWAGHERYWDALYEIT